MNKFILLISFANSLGGAQIRYLSLFQEITQRRNDYHLLLNRKLYNLAVSADLIDRNHEKIIVVDGKNNARTQGKLREKNVEKTIVSKEKTVFQKIGTRLKLFFKFLIFNLHLQKVFMRIKPDYVYSIWCAGMVAWPLKYINDFKFTYSYMDSGFSSLGSFFKHPLKSERMPLKHADTIDFLSYELLIGVKKRVRLPDKQRKAVAPCSFKNYCKLFAEKKVDTVIFCSRLTPIKNPLLFLKSVKVFNENYAGMRTVIFQVLGDGECMEDVLQYKSEHRLNNVEIVGFTDKPENYLRKSKIFVSIQTNNNYPSQSLLEAMACENAIIASDVGETRNLVTESEGTLVDLNENEIADAIYKLLENETRRMYLGSNARKKVLSEQTIERYLEYFYSLETL